MDPLLRTRYILSDCAVIIFEVVANYCVTKFYHMVTYKVQTIKYIPPYMHIMTDLMFIIHRLGYTNA